MPVNNLAPVPMFEFAENSPVSGTDLKSIINSAADADSEIEISAEFGNASYTGFVTIGGATAGIAAAGKEGSSLIQTIVQSLHAL